MKNLLFVLLIGVSITSFGQTGGKWSTGLSYTPSIQGGATFAINVNRHFGENWQIGVMPFGWFYGFENPGVNSLKSNSLGLNLTSRYSPVKLSFIKPYVYSFAGFGHSTFKYTFQNNPTEISNTNYLNFSLGAGAEINLGRRWSLDVNYGYLRLEFYEDNGYTNTMFFSVGILKRFGK